MSYLTEGVREEAASCRARISDELSDGLRWFLARKVRHEHIQGLLTEVLNWVTQCVSDGLLAPGPETVRFARTAALTMIQDRHLGKPAGADAAPQRDRVNRLKVALRTLSPAELVTYSLWSERESVGQTARMRGLEESEVEKLVERVRALACS